jgi:hypothetical protein
MLKRHEVEIWVCLDRDFVREFLVLLGSYRVRRQWRTTDGAEGTHAARFHSDHSQYVRGRNDGVDAGGAWTGGQAGDRVLMDANGRQRES